MQLNKDYKKFKGKDLFLFWFRYDGIFLDTYASVVKEQAISTTEISASDAQGLADHVPYKVDEEQEECDSLGNKSNENKLYVLDRLLLRQKGRQKSTMTKKLSK